MNRECDFSIRLFLFFLLSELIHDFFFWCSHIKPNFNHSCFLNFRVPSQRHICFTYRSFPVFPFLLSFIDRDMIFKLFIATQTGKVTLEFITSAFLTFVWANSIMLIMPVFTYTWSTPLRHIESLPSRKPPLTHFFRSGWYKLECSALARSTIGMLLVFCQNFFMVLKLVTTEAA
jgi:hypothetical protein